MPMPNKLPKFFDKHKICIICEGNEEYEYLKRLKDLNVWNEQYEVSLVNAGGNGNIPARYQDRYQNGADELVLVFCDTEKKPHEQYEDIKRKINVFHGVDNAADEVIMFGNPCTMQIISKHWTDENLKSPAKPVNVPLIKKYTGVENYKGRADQINEVMKYVTVENYKDMSRRVKDLDSDDSVTGSSNFGKFIKLFESDDSGWIEKINEFHGVNNAADEVIIFGNPCTMQIISKHWTDKNLKSPAKPVNAPLIKEYTGVENYKGRADQIHEVMEHVTAENYVDMSQRVRKLDSDDSVTGSSNFGKFIKLFESDDSGWIEAINKKIE